MIERRFTKGAEVRARGGDKPGIEGYAAVFGEDYVLYEDTGTRFVETIAAGAFTRVLKENQDTRCLFNHSADQVLGRTANKTLRMKQDKKGLSYDNDLDERTTCGQNVRAFVDRGDVTGCSFAFDVSKQSWRQSEEQDGKMKVYTRVIEEIRNLYDVGPVTYPAYEGTSVQGRAAELRSQILDMQDLPAEVRAKVEGRGKKCDCRCVACKRDEDCSKCTDHMVDCGDEKNCDHSRSKNPALAADVVNIEHARAEAEIDGRMRRAGLKVQ